MHTETTDDGHQGIRKTQPELAQVSLKVIPHLKSGIWSSIRENGP